MPSFELPAQPPQPRLPEQVPPESAEPLARQQFVPRPSRDQPTANTEATQAVQPSGPVSPTVVQAAFGHTTAEAPAGVETVAPEFGEERRFAAVYAGTPIDRYVQCSTQPVSFSDHVPTDKRCIVSGLSRGLEVPPDAGEPLRVRFIEAKNIYHSQVEAELDLPDAGAPAEDPDLITGNYWVGTDEGYPQAGLSLSYGANYDPGTATALTTAITRSIGQSILAHLPQTGPNPLTVMHSIGSNPTRFYYVREENIAQFDARIHRDAR